MRKNSKGEQMAGQPLLRLIDLALRRMGLTIPVTEEEVERAERELEAAPVEMPAELRDPYSLGRGRISEVVHSPLATGQDSAEVVEGLARAARAGAPIAPEYEEAMRRDRAEAESRRRGDGSSEP